MRIYLRNIADGSYFRFGSNTGNNILLLCGSYSKFYTVFDVGEIICV